ncbi:Low conductance mechanosensitive channel YnaI [compost metagenome]
MVTIPPVLEWPLVCLGAGLAFAAAMAFYTQGLTRLLLWSLKADAGRAQGAVRRLKGPYALMSAALAANILSIKTNPTVDWWLAALAVPAVVFFAIEVLRRVFVDVVVTPKNGAPIPKILKDLVFGLLYLAAGVACLGTVFKVDIAPFLTTSAILSVVLGLALQDTLGNLFSGIAINLDRPFSIGDWVEVDGHKGTIQEISWRATKILTPQHHTIVVPNSQVAKVRVVNFSAPTRAYGEWIEFRASYRVPPSQVRDAVLAIAAQVPGIYKTPVPTVDVLDYTPTAILYRLIIWIDDGPRSVPLRGKLLEELWYHFKRRGFDMPIPAQEIVLRDPRLQQETALTAAVKALRTVDFMRDFDDAVIEAIARQARHAHYAPESAIFHQGDAGGSFFLIQKGEVLLQLADAQGTEPVARLQAGCYFGEMSLLTGEPRTASARALTDCELLVIDEQDLGPLLEAHPEVLESVSRIIAQRRAGMDEVRQTMAERIVPQPLPEPESVEAASNEILGRIRGFFKLS